MSEIQTWPATATVDQNTQVLLNTGETVSMLALANLIADLLIKFDISPSALEGYKTYSQTAIIALINSMASIDLNQIITIVTNLVNNYPYGGIISNVDLNTITTPGKSYHINAIDAPTITNAPADLVSYNRPSTLRVSTSTSNNTSIIQELFLTAASGNPSAGFWFRTFVINGNWSAWAFYSSSTVTPPGPSGSAYMSLLVNPFQTELINLGNQGNGTNPFYPSKWEDLLGNFVNDSNADQGPPGVGYTSGGFSAGSITATGTSIVSGIINSASPYYNTPDPTIFGFITIPQTGFYRVTLTLAAGIATNPGVPLVGNIGGDFWLHGFRGSSNARVYTYRQALMMTTTSRITGLNSMTGPYSFSLDFFAQQGDKITLSLYGAFIYSNYLPNGTPAYASTGYIARGRNLSQVSDYTNVSNEFLKIELISD